MKRYHQHPVRTRITVLGIIAFSLWTFFIWTFSPHATAQRVERQQQSIEAQVNGLNAIYVQLAGQCFQFAADRDSLLTVVNWQFVQLWQTVDAQYGSLQSYPSQTSLPLTDETLEELDFAGN